jgi:hypothetical protein
MKQHFILLKLILVLFGCQTLNQEKDKGLNTSGLMCGPVTSDRDWYNSDNKAPLFEGLGELHFPVSTKDSLVQKYFNQGITLAYGFNHAEAARSFYYATKLDSNCAMAFWGYAYVLGPNYNAGMESDNYERAYNGHSKRIDACTKKYDRKRKDLIEHSLRDM